VQSSLGNFPQPPMLIESHLLIHQVGYWGSCNGESLWRVRCGTGEGRICYGSRASEREEPPCVRRRACALAPISARRECRALDQSVRPLQPPLPPPLACTHCAAALVRAASQRAQSNIVCPLGGLRASSPWHTHTHTSLLVHARLVSG